MTPMNRMPIGPLQIVLTNLTDTPKPKTGSTRRDVYRMFAKFVRAETVEQAILKLTALDAQSAEAVLERWKTTLTRAGRKANTVNTAMAAMNILISSLIKHKLVAWPLFKARHVTIHQDDRAVDIVVTDDFRRMLEKTKGNDWKSLRDYAILRCLWDRGLRRFEVATIQIENIDMETGQTRLQRKARSDLVSIVLPEKTMDAIRAWVKVRPAGGGAVFTNRAGKPLTGKSIYRIVQMAGARAGVKARPHAIRHGVATHLIGKSPIHEVQKFMGHRNVTTTQIYTHLKASVGDRLSDIASAL